MIARLTMNQAPKPLLHTTCEAKVHLRKATVLPADFVPGEQDVICGRGKMAKNHPGNAAFRHLMEKVMERYETADTKLEKSVIVSEVVNLVRVTDSGYGGFVKQEADGMWYEVDDLTAREKVGQSLRDLLHKKYRSSTKAKKVRRKAQNVQLHDRTVDLILHHKTVEGKMKHVVDEINHGASDQHLTSLLDEINIVMLNAIKLVGRQERTGNSSGMMSEHQMRHCQLGDSSSSLTSYYSSSSSYTDDSEMQDYEPRPTDDTPELFVEEFFPSPSSKSVRFCDNAKRENVVEAWFQEFLYKKQNESRGDAFIYETWRAFK